MSLCITTKSSRLLIRLPVGVRSNQMQPSATSEIHLTTKQRKAVEALLTTGEVGAAAREVGISRVTLFRWMQQADFAQAVREAEARAIDDLSRMLVRLGRSATSTLAKAMNDPATPAAT